MRPIAAAKVSAIASIVIASMLTVIATRDDDPITRLPPPDLTVVLPPMPPMPPPPPTYQEPPRCCACAMEDMRRAGRARRHVITARYLGEYGRFDEAGNYTRERCRPDNRIWAKTRFTLTSKSPWTEPDFTRDRLSRMTMSVPCPELSRAAYRKMFGIRDRDEDEDGLGNARRLTLRQNYTLEVLQGVDLAVNDRHPDGVEFIWTVTAIDP